MILLLCGEDGVERFQLREKERERERESSVCFYILFFSEVISQDAQSLFSPPSKQVTQRNVILAHRLFKD